MDVEGIDPVAVYGALMSTLVRTVFAQPDAASAWAQHARVVDQLAERFPAATELLADAATDLLAFTAFPAELAPDQVQQSQERLNSELAERVYRPEV
jgi:putative transposase